MTQIQKLSPIHQTAQAHGAPFTTLAGWQVPVRFSDTNAEAAAARRSVALADASARGKIRLEGKQAGKLLQAEALPVGAGQAADIAGRGSRLYRLRANLFFISTPPGREGAAAASLAAAAGDSLVTVTDITHGRSELLLIGPAAATVLSRLCGLDFHPSSFPNGTARQSSVAKTAQLIIRQDLGDLPAYSLIGARSLAAYLWETIQEAGRDAGLVLAGQAALEKLEAAAAS